MSRDGFSKDSLCVPSFGDSPTKYGLDVLVEDVWRPLRRVMSAPAALDTSNFLKTGQSATQDQLRALDPEPGSLLAIAVGVPTGADEQEPCTVEAGLTAIVVSQAVAQKQMQAQYVSK